MSSLMGKRLVAGATSKDCTKCGLTLPISAFHIRPDGKPRPECKECKAAYQQFRRVHYREYLQEYRRKNGDRTRTKARLRYRRIRKRDADWRRKKRLSDPIGAMLRRAKTRAKKFGVPFSITRDDIMVPDVCPALGVPFGKLGRGKGAKPDSMSLDRIIPSKGYVPGNVQVISQQANRMKTNATAAELRSFALWVLAQ